MKKSLLLSSLLVIILVSGKSQIYFPSPSENPFWIEQHDQIWSCSTEGTYGYCYGYYCMRTKPVYYKTDTVINGTTYNRLFARTAIGRAVSPGGPSVGCPYTYSFQEPESLYAIIRQDTTNKRVYIWNYGNEQLLYDFGNMIVGQLYPETYNSYPYDTLVVVSEDSVMMGSVYHKKWDLARTVNGVIVDAGFVSVIEGIGSNFGIIAMFNLPFEWWDELLCFSMDGNVLYPDSGYNCDVTINAENLELAQDYHIYPNPARYSITVETNLAMKSDCLLEIFNSDGVKVLDSQLKNSSNFINLSFIQSGIYFMRLMSSNTVVTKKLVIQR